MYSFIVLIKTIKFISLLIGMLVVAFFLSFVTKAFLNIYYKTVENNKKIKFVEEGLTLKNTPSICFSSAYKLAKETNTILPPIVPMGSLPNGRVLVNKNIINFDRFGFRNNNLDWENESHDYLILGDSYVADLDIADDFLFSNNFHSSKSVINLGCGGNGLLTSLNLLEQFFSAGHFANEVLFFINLESDISKDILREYKTGYFRETFNEKKSKNLFLNQNKYEKDFLGFLKESFVVSINNFSVLNEIASEFDKHRVKSELNKVIKILKKVPNKEKVFLEDGTFLDSSLIPRGMYTVESRNIFFKVLERVSNLKSKYNTSITFLIVPTNHEIEVYNHDKKNDKDWQRFLNYKILKNTIMTIIANYNMNIIDLIYFDKKNNYKNFINGHLTKEAHPSLPNYIKASLENNYEKKLSKHMFYSSFFSAKRYYPYQSNVEKKLNKQQIEDWISILNFFIEESLMNNYLLSSALGYFFINQDCQSIKNLYKTSNGLSSNYSVGDFFYKICTLKESENIETSLKEINMLIDTEVKYYLPDITHEIKKALNK